MQRQHLCALILLVGILLSGCAKKPQEPPTEPPLEPGPPPVIGAIDLTAGQPPSITLAESPASPGPPADLAALHFLSAQVGFGATSGGTIHRTDDGGRTWKQIAAFSGTRFREIAFTDSARGWVLGATECPGPDEECKGPAVLLLTADGGESWKAGSTEGFPVPAGGASWWNTTLAFVTPDFGYATVPGSNGDSASLLLSVDGGLSWRQVPVAAGTALTGHAQFLSPELGFVTVIKGAEHQLLRTGDGGQSWQVLYATEEFSLAAVQFLDDQRGYLGGGNGHLHYRQGPQEPRRVLLTTQDGGTTWQEVHRTNEMEAGPFRVLQFESAERGWASDGGSFNGGGLLSTVDGGRTWQRHLAPRVVVTFSAVGDRVWVPWGSHLYRTEDRGATWSTLFQAAALGPRRVQFLDEQVGYLNAEVGLFKTTDGGRTWSPYPVGSPVDPWWEPAWPYFVDEETALAYKGTVYDPRSQLLRSSDGGQSWGVAARPSFTPAGPPKVSFVDSERGWMAQPDGTTGPASPYPDLLLQSTDGGRTWSYMSAKLPVNSRIDFANQYYGVAANGHMDDGRLLLTADGGENWSAYPLGDFWAYSVQQVDQAHIWVAGSTFTESPAVGLLLHSANGGKSWSVWREPQSDFDPFHLEFVSPEVGWLVARVKGESVLLKTEDGGQSWQQSWPVIN